MLFVAQRGNAEVEEEEEKETTDNCNLTNVIKNFTIHLWTNQIKIIVCHINLMTDPDADIHFERAI